MTPVGDLRSTAAASRPPATALGSAHAVHARPLAAQVAHELMSAILQGAFKPGDTIPSEEALCERFDVSRPVVREAVKTLAKVGMVRTRQGQGSMVLSEEHWNELAPELLVARCETGTADEVLAEVIELRGVLEARAAEAAARRAGPVDLERLHAHLVAMKTMADDREQYLFHDLQFHREVLRLGGNRMVVKLFDLLEPMLLSARRVALDHQELPEGMLPGSTSTRRSSTPWPTTRLRALARRSSTTYPASGAASMPSGPLCHRTGGPARRRTENGVAASAPAPGAAPAL